MDQNPTGISQLKPSSQDGEIIFKVRVNAGFGGRSYECPLYDTGEVILPSEFLREIHASIGDVIEYALNPDDDTIYFQVVHQGPVWEKPDWLDDDGRPSDT